MRITNGIALAAVFLTIAHPVEAQRASENAVTSAQDAFGTSVGDDDIGLYSSTSARGFSPKDAGNMRIEGLFYDEQGNFGYANQVGRSTTMRVGLSAQSYPFPAPTGIADIRLRLPGDETIFSVGSSIGPYSGSFAGQLDLEMPIIDDKLGMVLGAAAGHPELDFRADFHYVDLSALFHFTPSDDLEFITFYQRSDAKSGESPPLYFTGGAFLPPEVDRSEYAAPNFRHHRMRLQTNFGLIGRGLTFGNWRLQAGFFRSINSLRNDFSILFTNIQPDGTADFSVRTRPDPWLGSYSGEVRASGVYTEGPRRHTFHVSAKGRSGKRTFGGDDTLSFGTRTIGSEFDFATPTGFNLGIQDRDKTRYGAAGVSYVGQWLGVGEISVGVQKAFYKRNVDQAGTLLTTTQNNPWLYNGTLAIQGNEDLTVYASYTRGLEDSGIAPENAANPGEALAASLTEQIDAGVRYRLTPDITMVAGVFEVKKPYFDRDSTNVFTRVGSLSHQGVEMSVAGAPLEGLKVVAGAVLLKARVSGTTVDLGLIGEVPPGQPPVLVRFNADYGPAAWRGFSINGRVNYEDSHNANRLNTLRIPSITTVDLGARYNFRASDISASLRFDVRNVTNVFAWTVAGASGRYSPLAARRYVVRLAADF